VKGFAAMAQVLATIKAEHAEKPPSSTTNDVHSSLRWIGQINMSLRHILKIGDREITRRESSIITKKN